MNCKALTRRSTRRHYGTSSSWFGRRLIPTVSLIKQFCKFELTNVGVWTIDVMDSHPVMNTTHRRVIGVSTDQIATSAVFYKSHMVSTSQGALTRTYGTGSDFRKQNYNCLLELSAFILKKYCYNNTQILSEFFGYTKLGSH